METSAGNAPLAGLRIVEVSSTVAAAYAGRLLATLGAETILAEPPGGHRLRQEPPFLDEAGKASALFSYLAAGKKSVECSIETDTGRHALANLIGEADLLICDVPLRDRASCGLDEDTLVRQRPALIYVSVLPFGSVGPKAHWKGEELNLIHAAGEGFLLPNGLSAERFPERAPLKIHGYFAELQGGVVAALGALAALLSPERTHGEAVDISVQDAMLAVGAFAVQRLGDGSLEHRLTRSFKYGGVLECADGDVELLTLEERQWQGLVELMGQPEWALDPTLSDSLERSRRGCEINTAIRAWAKQQNTADLVARAQTLGVPMAKYSSPSEVLGGAHEQARGLFQRVHVPGVGPCRMLVAPFHFSGLPLELKGGPPELGHDQRLLSQEQRPAPAREKTL